MLFNIPQKATQFSYLAIINPNQGNQHLNDQNKRRHGGAMQGLGFKTQTRMNSVSLSDLCGNSNGSSGLEVYCIPFVCTVLDHLCAIMSRN